MSRLLTWIAAHPFWVLLAVAGVTLTSFAGIYDRQTGELRLKLDPSAAGLAAEGDEAQLFFDIDVDAVTPEEAVEQLGYSILLIHGLADTR